MEKVDLYQYEKELWKNGINLIAGMDEVGRGPLIGPVVTACVILPKDFVLEGLTDSKKLSEKKREEFYDYIMEHAISVGIGMMDEKVIDEVNIYEATKLAMYQAVEKSKVKPEHVLIDAMKLDKLEMPSTSIIKGDAKSISIAAASVIAKVTRDRMMIELDKKYPMYGFKSHKGYPTKKHIEAIKEYGLIDGYRKTFKPISEMVKELENQK
jgi:ribonuclease HII